MDLKPCRESEEQQNSALLVLASGCLAINSIAAIYGGMKEPWPRMTAFVIASYAALLLLLWCFRELDRNPDGSPNKWRLKVVAWMLSNFLMVTLCYWGAAIMPPFSLYKVLTWVMAASTAVITFCGHFVFQPQPRSKPVIYTTTRTEEVVYSHVYVTVSPDSNGAAYSPL